MSAQSGDKPQQPGYGERAKTYYNQQYESWMPWIEDNFLHYFTKDNKASYTTKDQLSKTKVTGVEQVDKLQDGVNNLVAGQVGQGGLAQPLGDAVSKEGFNRAERQGKDDSGDYGPGGIGNSVVGGAKSAGGYVSGMWGGNKDQKK